MSPMRKPRSEARLPTRFRVSTGGSTRNPYLARAKLCLANLARLGYNLATTRLALALAHCPAT